MKLGGSFSKLSMPKRVALVVAIILLLLIVIPLGVRWIHYRLSHAVTDNAFVESDLSNISPLVSGHLKEIVVDESDSVKKGQLLALLDEKDYLAQVELKRSMLAKVKRDVSALETTLERMRREVEQGILLSRQAILEAKEALARVEADGKRIEGDYLRFKDLLERQAVAQSRFDAIESQSVGCRALTKSASILVMMRETGLKKALIGRQRVEELEKRLRSLEAAGETAQKALEIAQLNLEHTRIKSPMDGIIAKKFINEGSFISPGIPVFSLYNQDNIYVTANLEESKIAGVKLGQEVDLKVDGYPGVDFKGEVIKIGEASAAKFLLVPRTNPTGEFVKEVQRIPIKIAVDNTNGLLRPGFSVTVGIKID